MQASRQISGSRADMKNPRQTRENISRERKSSSVDTTQRRMYRTISIGNADMCVVWKKFCNHSHFRTSEKSTIFFFFSYDFLANWLLRMFRYLKWTKDKFENSALYHYDFCKRQVKLKNCPNIKSSIPKLKISRNRSEIRPNISFKNLQIGAIENYSLFSIFEKSKTRKFRKI